MKHQVSFEDTKHFVRLTRNLLYNQKRKYGAKAIQDKLAESGYPDIPSIKSIHSILKNAKEQGLLFTSRFFK